VSVTPPARCACRITTKVPDQRQYGNARGAARLSKGTGMIPSYENSRRRAVRSPFTVGVDGPAVTGPRPASRAHRPDDRGSADGTANGSSAVSAVTSKAFMVPALRSPPVRLPRPMFQRRHSRRFRRVGLTLTTESGSRALAHVTIRMLGNNSIAAGAIRATGPRCCQLLRCTADCFFVNRERQR
jgi:hypothetical protein